jgi:hypothetical protein
VQVLGEVGQVIDYFLFGGAIGEGRDAKSTLNRNPMANATLIRFRDFMGRRSLTPQGWRVKPRLLTDSDWTDEKPACILQASSAIIL